MKGSQQTRRRTLFVTLAWLERLLCAASLMTDCSQAKDSKGRYLSTCHGQQLVSVFKIPGAPPVGGHTQAARILYSTVIVAL